MNDIMFNTKPVVFFVSELKRLFWTEKELSAILPGLVNAATSSQLKDNFERQLLQTHVNITRLKQIFANLGQVPAMEECTAMAGVLEEADKLILYRQKDGGENDIALIFNVRKATHLAIAAYNGMAVLTPTLSNKVAETLMAILNEKMLIDHKLTDILLNEQQR